MKTRIIYCLTSDGSDYYYEQLLISLCSLRKHCPQAVVEVVCDNNTFATLKDKRSGIFEYDVLVKAIATPENWGKWERSRYLKTHLRKLVQGDYLYIDTDTVICSSLACVDEIPYEVAAVKDSHVDRQLPRASQCRHETEQWIWREAEKAHVNIEGRWHFNSGVMYVKDTPKAHELYALWADYYQQFLARGSRVDQLPLLCANHEMNNFIAPLDPALNCQVSFAEGRKNTLGARIIHYFPGQGKTLLSSPWIMDPVKETGRINRTIQRIIDHPSKFFQSNSRIVMGEEADFLETPGLLEAYFSSPKVFRFFDSLLNAYLYIKKSLYAMIH